MEFIWTEIEIKNYKAEIIVIETENDKYICDWKLKFRNLSENINHMELIPTLFNLEVLIPSYF